MSPNNATTEMAAADNANSSGKEPTPKEAFFFMNIISCMKNRPDVDWDMVAQKSSYSNGACARARFGQIKKRLGYAEDTFASAANASPKTPKKPRVKQEKTVGSGTNTTPSKVTKKASPKKSTPTKPEDTEPGQFAAPAEPAELGYFMKDEYADMDEEDGQEFVSNFSENGAYYDFKEKGEN